MGTRQACSLLILTVVLVGSCVALAIRTLLESGSGMLLVLLTLGFLASMMSVAVNVTRRHVRARREQGFQTACFGCLQIEPDFGTQERPNFPRELRAASMSASHREQMELSMRSALSALPEAPFTGADDAECSLCMDSLLRGEMCRTLPSCGHQYHSK